MKKMIALCLAFMMTIIPTTALAEGEPSSWAQDEIDQAIELNLVPEELQENYTSDITRAEFAKIAVIFAARANGYDDVGKFVDRYVAVYDSKPFSDEIFPDTEDIYVNCAATVGIVHGRDDGTFDPNGRITRQEAAVMLLNTYLTYTGGIEHSANELSLEDTFIDVNSVADWAKDGVTCMWRWGVMTGVSDNEYLPLSYYTREQAIATFMRLYQSGPQNIASENIESPLWTL